jgi:hypothetical protein
VKQLVPEQVLVVMHVRGEAKRPERTVAVHQKVADAGATVNK